MISMVTYQLPINDGTYYGIQTSDHLQVITTLIHSLMIDETFLFLQYLLLESYGTLLIKSII